MDLLAVAIYLMIFLLMIVFYADHVDLFGIIW
jgi:hypothetical protein